MPRTDYVVAGLTFARKSDIEAHISRILNGGPLPSIVGMEDEPFLRALLATRADKLLEIGQRSVVRFERDWQPGPFRRTRTVWLVCEDGLRLDFSLYKAVGLLKPGVDPVGAGTVDVVGDK